MASLADFNSTAGSFVPPGVILPYGGPTAPSGWLLCDGSPVSRTTYAPLFAAISTAWGYGDNSTTFNLPDMRGRFPRGRDGGIARDPDRASRTVSNTGGNTGDNVGSVQSEAYKGHSHQISVAGKNAISFGDGTGNAQPPDTYNTLRMIAVRGIDGGGASATNPQPGGGDWNSNGSGANETRPLNANVNYIIKI